MEGFTDGEMRPVSGDEGRGQLTAGQGSLHGAGSKDRFSENGVSQEFKAMEASEIMREGPWRNPLYYTLTS